MLVLVVVGVVDAIPIVNTTALLGGTCVCCAGLCATTKPTFASSTCLSVVTVKPCASRVDFAFASVNPTTFGKATVCAPLDT